MLSTAAGEAAIRVHLDELPYGDYKVFPDYVHSPQGSPFSVWQRHTPLTGWLLSQASDTIRFNQHYVTDISLGHLNQALTLRFKPKAPGTSSF